MNKNSNLQNNQLTGKIPVSILPINGE